MSDLFKPISEFLYRLWLSFIDFMEDFFLWLVDTLLSLLIYVLEKFTYLFSMLDVTQYISAIPPDVANVMSLIGLGEAMGIIIVAGTIRIFLQIIPFVRLGS